MAKITNTLKGDVGLGFSVIIPGGGSVDVDDKALAKAKRSAVVASYFETGILTEYGPKPSARSSSTLKTSKVKD